MTLIPACCRCNASGKCSNCICRKKNQSCTNCQPSRSGKCENESVQQPGPNQDLDRSTLLETVRNEGSNENVPNSRIDFGRDLSNNDELTDNAADNMVDGGLPTFISVSNADFVWGDLEGKAFITSIDCAYEEIVHWKKNLFKVPSGKQGKLFVRELARLYSSYAEGGGLEQCALKAAMTFPTLLLQKPSHESKSKEHCSCIERRLGLWRAGEIDCLINEGRTIQNRLIRSKHLRKDEDRLSFRFAKMMMEGKTRSALRLLQDEHQGTVLSPDSEIETSDGKETVLNVLMKKHPKGQPLIPEAVTSNKPTPQDIHPIIFEKITAKSISDSALRTEGSAGPSGLDAVSWRRICCSFQGASVGLCGALALVARKIASTYVDPVPLRPLTACRLIALDKCPGIRPIGIGEVPRRIIAKAILHVIRDDIKAAVGPLQCCAGQLAACESGIHAMQDLSLDPDTEGKLFIDASNAFNLLNRNNMLINILNQCPLFAKIVINIYRVSSDLYIGGKRVISDEGITQGDPLAMPIYALGILPLIHKVSNIAKQLWYADDA